MLFGPHPSMEPVNNTGKNGEPALASQLDERFLRARQSELILRMGKYLYFLQGVFNFTLRCQKLTKNIVCQIAGCYNGDIPFLSQNVDLVPLGEALVALFRLLITIDTAISSNSDLLEAWGLFKAAVKDQSLGSSKVCLVIILYPNVRLFFLRLLMTVRTHMLIVSLSN